MTLLLMILCIAAGFVWGMAVRELVEAYRTIVKSTRSYRLWKLTTSRKTGIIIGINSNGKLWIELKHNGKTLENYNIIEGVAV